MAQGFEQVQQAPPPVGLVNAQPNQGLNPWDAHPNAPKVEDDEDEEMEDQFDEEEEKPAAKQYIKRPPNAFMLFRKANHANTVQANPGLTNGVICK